MPRFADRVDYIVQRFLRSLPEGELTFHRTLWPGLITYTLFIRQVKVGLIEIESGSTPAFGTLIRFSVIQNSFAILHDNTRIVLEITKLNDLIMQEIKAETGKLRWIEVTAEPQPETTVRGVRPAQTTLLENTIYVDSVHYKRHYRQPWEIIPDRLWDRLAVRLWCAGFSSHEIARRVNVQPRSVANRLSMLRKKYPHAGIPTNEQRIKLLLLDEIPIEQTDDMR